MAKSSKKSLMLTAALDRFLLNMSTARRSSCTMRDYRQRLLVLLQLLATRCTDDGKMVSITDLKQVTTDHLRQVISILQTENVGRFRGHERIAGPLAPSSVHTYVLTFKSFFSWCYREGLLSSNPADDRLALPKVSKEVRSTFSAQDIQVMLDACDRVTEVGYRDFTILLLLFDTGMRISELAWLRLENVHAEYVKVSGKGRKEREIGIHSATSMVLWKYIELHRNPAQESEQRVFIGMYGKPLNRTGVHQAIKRIQVKAGLEDIQVHAHLFRHTFAKFYMENGGDLFSLSRELGHSDVQTTKIYLEGFNSTQARKEHSKFSPVSLIQVKETGRRRKK